MAYPPAIPLECWTPSENQQCKLDAWYGLGIGYSGAAHSPSILISFLYSIFPWRDISGYKLASTKLEALLWDFRCEGGGLPPFWFCLCKHNLGNIGTYCGKIWCPTSSRLWLGVEKDVFLRAQFQADSWLPIFLAVASLIDKFSWLSQEVISGGLQPFQEFC